MIKEIEPIKETPEESKARFDAIDWDNIFEKEEPTIEELLDEELDTESESLVDWGKVDKIRQEDIDFAPSMFDDITKLREEK